MKTNLFGKGFFTGFRLAASRLLPSAAWRNRPGGRPGNDRPAPGAFPWHTNLPGIKWFPFLVPGIILLNLSCNKSSGVNENKAYVAISHVAPGFSGLNVLYNGISILGDNGLAYGQTSQSGTGPYVEATAGVRMLQVTDNGGTVLQGNTAFLQGQHYSVFLYDTLKNDSLKMFILQDNLQAYRDTLTYVRFINFSPGPGLNLVLSNQRNTVVTGFREFAGNNLKASNYTYQLIPIGVYEASAWRDDTLAHSIPLGSVQIESLKNYTLFLQGYADSAGVYGLKLGSIQHN
jgi:hypothetical protein